MCCASDGWLCGAALTLSDCVALVVGVEPTHSSGYAVV
jgi:hypothetical protein